MYYHGKNPSVLPCFHYVLGPPIKIFSRVELCPLPPSLPPSSGPMFIMSCFRCVLLPQECLWYIFFQWGCGYAPDIPTPHITIIFHLKLILGPQEHFWREQITEKNLLTYSAANVVILLLPLWCYGWYVMNTRINNSEMFASFHHVSGKNLFVFLTFTGVSVGANYCWRQVQAWGYVLNLSF